MLESGVNRLSEGLLRFSHALQQAIAVPNKHLVEKLRLGSEWDVHRAKLCMQSWRPCVHFVSQAAEQQENTGAARHALALARTGLAPARSSRLSGRTMG